MTAALFVLGFSVVVFALGLAMFTESLRPAPPPTPTVSRPVSAARVVVLDRDRDGVYRTTP